MNMSSSELGPKPRPVAGIGLGLATVGVSSSIHREAGHIDDALILLHRSAKSRAAVPPGWFVSHVSSWPSSSASLASEERSASSFSALRESSTLPSAWSITASWKPLPASMLTHALPTTTSVRPISTRPQISRPAASYKETRSRSLLAGQVAPGNRGVIPFEPSGGGDPSSTLSPLGCRSGYAPKRQIER